MLVEGRWSGAKEDVAANREGRLSPAQDAHMRAVADKVARGGLTPLQLVALLLGLFGGPGVAAAIAQTTVVSDELKTGLVIGGLVTSIAFIAAFFLYLRSDGARRRGLARDPYARAVWADVHAGRVAAWDGELRWTGERYEATAAGAPIHLVASAGPTPVHTLAAPPGAYRFYALPTSRLAVGLESIGAGVDRAAYARAIAEAAGPPPEPSIAASASAIEGPATVRYESRSSADDDRSYWVPVLEIQGVSVDISAKAATAIVPGFPVRAWFIQDKSARRLVRIEPA